MKHLFFFCTLLICCQASGQTFQNVLISNAGRPEEISICISPKDTNVVVAGANLTYAFHSNDGGLTWGSETMTDPYGVWGDPCVITDTAGNFCYFHLAYDPAITIWPKYCDRIILQTSTDGGLNFNPTSYTGYNLPKMQDKAWGAVDPSSNYMAVSWTQFDNYGVQDIQDSSKIYFSLSKNNGVNWTSPIVLSQITGDCVDSSNTAEGAVPAFGLHGEIYVIWSINDSLYMNRSVDTGNTWMPHEKAIAAQAGWSYNVAGLNRCDGLPTTIVDHSTSAYKGNIYVNWTDKRNGPNDADVFFIKSTDGGNTWSPTLRVNDDGPGNENFMSTMNVDQSTGDIYILYYDRRNYGDDNTDVYMAYSFNGGDSFTNVKVSSAPFYPDSSEFFGDYIGISAVNGCVRPAWMRMDNSITSVWTALINKGQLLPLLPNAIHDQEEENGFLLASCNPTTSACIIHYGGNQPFEVTITDLAGKMVLNKKNETETFYAHLDESGISNGTYLVNCVSNSSEKTFKVVMMK